MLKTVKDMYKYADDNNIKLLSGYAADFWKDYRDNYQRYDNLFCRYFRSWFYFLQEHDEDIEDIVNKFVIDVYSHLMVNDRKYSELYRIHVLPDEDYSLTNNYDMHEIMDKDTTSNNTNTYGARTDGDTIGAQSNSVTNTVAPYNTSSFQNDNKSEESQGARTDSHTKGTQEDTLDNTGTEDYTLHRYGNIGVMTVTDMLKKHDEYWTHWEFYERIFRDIARELLMIGGC